MPVEFLVIVFDVLTVAVNEGVIALFKELSACTLV